MDKEETKETIKKIINESNGIKGMELVALRWNLNTDDIPELLDELVKEGSIIEIEFVLPHLDYRIKSFYLPKGTELRLRGNFVAMVD